MAKIEIIMGSMYSGKSTELIRRCRRYECIGNKVKIINHSFDTRCDENSVQTHSNHVHEAYKTDKLLNINIDSLQNIDVIGIDEAQFFDDLPQFIDMIERTNKIIIVAGLDGDFRRQKFGKILDIIPKADCVTKLSALCSYCRNGTLASFTKKTNDSDDIIDVGASDKYVAVCREHYFALSNGCHI
jgi:thymidine kinase